MGAFAGAASGPEGGPAAQGPDYSLAPLVLFWEVTRACALKCLHCRAAAQPFRHPLELTLQEGFRLLQDIASFEPRPVLVLTGGDPFMRPDLLDLVAYSLSLGLRTALSPSATRLVTRHALQRLRALGLSRISFSLDGPSPQVHDAFRGVRGSFLRTVECIRDALDAGLSLQVNTTVSRHNVRDLPRIADFLLSFAPRLLLWDLFFLVPTGRGRREDLLSPEEHEGVYNWLYTLAREVPFRIKTTLGQHYRRVYIQRAAAEGQDPRQAWREMAMAATNDGKGVCFVSHIGEVYPSGFLPLPCGNVREQSVVSIYRTSPVFQALRDPARLKGKCGRCPFKTVCGGCRARAYACAGDYLQEDPSCLFQPEGSGDLGPTW